VCLLSLCDKAFYGGSVLFVIAAVHLLLTLVFPVSAAANKFEIYSRNVVSIVTLICMGMFLKQWAVYNSDDDHKADNMKPLKILTLVVSVACALKGLISALFCAMQLLSGNLTGLFYFGEFVFCVALFIFFINYYRNIITEEEADGGSQEINVDEFGYSEEVSEDYSDEYEN